MLTPMTIMCPGCGVVCFQLRTACRRDVKVETATIYIYPNDAGEDLGYTEDGRLVRGDKVKREDFASLKLYECHAEHACPCRAEVTGQERRLHGVA